MLQKCSIFKVLEVFFNEPSKEHYLMEISKKSGIAHTSTKKYLQELIKLLIIKENLEKKGKRIFPLFIVNLESQKYLHYKKLSNQDKLIESNLIDYLKDNIMPECIVVFGSYQKGEDDETSDIDIYVQSNKKELNLSSFEKKLKRKIQIHFQLKFKNYPEELKNNIINGVVLYGYLEALR